MYTQTFIRAFLELAVVVFITFLLLHENRVITFEKRAAKYIRCFFKALILTVREKFGDLPDENTVYALSNTRRAGSLGTAVRRGKSA